MRKIILFMALLAASFAASAQCYIYEVTGSASVFRNGEWATAHKTMALSARDSVRTGEMSSVVVLDRKNGRLYAFQSREAETLEKLISTQKPKSRKLLGETVQSLFNILFTRNEKSMAAYHTVSGVTYRGEEEDMLIAAAIAADQPSSEDLTFRMLDFHSAKPLTEVRSGSLAVLEVTNRTDSPLYFNLIDIDPSGQMAPVLPFDEAHTMLHLFIPPHSVVRLKEYPVEFYGSGVDRLILVASEYVFNLQNVIRMIPSARASRSTKVHIQRSSIHIRPQ